MSVIWRSIVTNWLVTFRSAVKQIIVARKRNPFAIIEKYTQSSTTKSTLQSNKTTLEHVLSSYMVIQSTSGKMTINYDVLSGKLLLVLSLFSK